MYFAYSVSQVRSRLSFHSFKIGAQGARSQYQTCICKEAYTSTVSTNKLTVLLCTCLHHVTDTQVSKESFVGGGIAHSV